MDVSSKARVNLLAAAALALLAAGPWELGGPRVAEAKESGGGRAKGAFDYGCRVQSPQRFLKRRTFVQRGTLDPKKHARALRYFSEHYGHAGTDTTLRYNSASAIEQAKTVQFFGMPISIHAKIAPALACVEKRIRGTCTGKSSRYTPRAVGGFRSLNSYRGAEVSNHLFGIAIDIDPERNPCCGCVDPWPTSPLCKDNLPGKEKPSSKEGSSKKKKKAQQKATKEKPLTAYDRTALTRCWIRSFERFGFDWLGHDELEDTMHFEFLGDPDRIKR